VTVAELYIPNVIGRMPQSVVFSALWQTLTVYCNGS